MEELNLTTLALRIGLDSVFVVPIVLLVLWIGRSFFEKVVWASFDNRAKERLEQLKSDLNFHATSETERLKADLQTSAEAYKLALKKAEFLFGKQFEAASAFISLYESFNPRAITPDMDYHEASFMVAVKAGEIERESIAFIREHGAALDGETRIAVGRLIHAASEGKHGPQEDADVDASEIGADLWGQMKMISETLIRGLHREADVKPQT